MNTTQHLRATPLLFHFKENEKESHPLQENQSTQTNTSAKFQDKSSDGMARVGIALAVVLVACLWTAALAYTGGGFGVMDSVATSSSARTCHGTLGQCAVQEDEEMGTPDEALLRRSLAARKPTNRYISYAALRADQVPCNKRGRSYYTNCASQQPANPYRRGCSAITRCSRNMN